MRRGQPGYHPRMTGTDERLARLRASLAAAPDIESLPPVSAQAVAAFEARRRITLPDEHRRFLLEVSGGILLDGEPWLYGLDDIDLATGDRVDSARPFPYSDAEASAIRAVLATAPPGGPLSDPAFLALQREGAPDGCLTLTCNGGNDFSVLVVTGEQRGWMWRTGELDAPESRRRYDPTGDDAPLSFLDWLRPWALCFLGVEFDV